MTGFIKDSASTSGGGAGDFATGLTGVLQTGVQQSGGDAAGLLLGVAGGAANLFVPGAGALVSGIVSLFSGKKTDVAQQSRDINTIAAYYGITGAEAGDVISNHANNSRDDFDDLAASVARPDGLSRFPHLLAEYNSANPGRPIQLGSIKREAEQVAQQQQKLITTALTTSNFASTATGQQFVYALQQLPGTQAVGSQGQTVGEILEKILGGAQKGAADAAADTAWGKKFKWSYIQDWLKENQLLAFFLAIIAGLGLLTLANVARGKHGKISF